MQMESTIENWKYMIQLKYENKRNKDSLTKGDIMKVKEIPIEILVEKFIGAKIPKNQIIECLFHKDSTGSLKIYPETNSFYCFGCQKG
jgi:DNA primase